MYVGAVTTSCCNSMLVTRDHRIIMTSQYDGRGGVGVSAFVFTFVLAHIQSSSPSTCARFSLVTTARALSVM